MAKEQQKRTFKYGMENVSFWNKESTDVLSISFRRETTRKYNEAVVKIAPLDENRKKFKQDDVFVEGFFPLNASELSVIICGMELLDREDISQFEINHLNDESSGTQLEFIRQDDLYQISINQFDKGEHIKEFIHIFDRIREVTCNVDPETGEGSTFKVNTDWINFKESIRFSISCIGTFDAMASLSGRISDSQQGPGQVGNTGLIKRTKKIGGVSGKNSSKLSSVKEEKIDKAKISKLFQDEEAGEEDDTDE